MVIIVVDLGFGDAGKGTIVDFLTRHHQAHTVVRFNGGAQAAHNVITPDGRHHTFAQFGSGTFIPSVQTYLSRFMMLDPYAMFNEEAHLAAIGVHDAFARTFIDRRALVITPFQQAANRLKELARGEDRHGSCGVGVGQTAADYLRYGDAVLFAGDMLHRSTTRKKLRFLLETRLSEVESLRPAVQHLDAAQDDLVVFDDADEIIDVAVDNYVYLTTQVNVVDEDYLRARLHQPGTVIFEGAQGVLLDEWYGFHPYTTWSTTTFENAITLLAEQNYQEETIRLGVLRTYATRHGAGPFVTEATPLDLPEPHNVTNPWQQSFRVGYFDLVATRYALGATDSVDALAITHMDRALSQWCDTYHYTGASDDLSDFFEHISQCIIGIRLCRPPNLAHQAGLTQRLLRCRPHYISVPADFVAALEDALGVRVAITSYGPTANDKSIMYWPS